MHPWLFYVSVFFSVSLSVTFSVSFILFFFILFLPLTLHFHKIPPLFVFTFISPLLLSVFVSPLSASSTAAEQINELAPNEPDTSRRHCKDMLYVTQQDVRGNSLKAISITAIVSHLKGFKYATESVLCKYTVYSYASGMAQRMAMLVSCTDIHVSQMLQMCRITMISFDLQFEGDHNTWSQEWSGSWTMGWISGMSKNMVNCLMQSAA